MKKLKILLISLLCLILVCSVAIGIYTSDYYRADTVAASATVSSEKVSVTTETDDMVVFRPDDPKCGFIFYPGGKVEYTAYAPLMNELAENGIMCVLLKMPLNLAVLDVNAADGIAESYPDIKLWYIGGHSLGGSMAASYASENADKLKGVVLLASYSTADLNSTDLKVASVYGSNDGVLNMEKYNGYKPKLPEATLETIIDGGCHAYFGSYGTQDGDGIPTITAEEQLKETVEILKDFLK